jgi:hypothetical protein
MIDQQGWIPDRQTYILYRKWIHERKKNSMRVVNSVLHNELYINTLMSCCRETLAGGRLARKDKVWSSPPCHAFSMRLTHLYAEARMMSIFNGDCSLGEGVNVCPTLPPSPQRIPRRSPKMRVTNTGRGPRHAPTRPVHPCPPLHSIRQNSNSKT